MYDDPVAMRASAFEALGAGDVRAAFSHISGVLATGTYTLDDLYLAGEWALDSGLYRDAINLLTRAISASTSEGECWYIDSAYIARAYARVQIGEYDLAQNDLAQIDDNVELSWLRNHPAVSKRSLLICIKSE